MSNFRLSNCLLGDLITLQRGFDITKKEQHAGPIPVVTSSGPSSTHTEFSCRGPGVVIGRKGTLGNAYFIEGPYWAHDTTLWVKDFKGNDPKYIFYLLQSMDLAKYDVGSSNPTLNRNHLHLLSVSAPSIDGQRRIAEVLSAYDDLIDVNQLRITILAQAARQLFDEWFVRFRYPGYDAVPLIETKLGKAPTGWDLGRLCDCVSVNPETLSPKSAPDQIHYIDISSVSVGRLDNTTPVAFADAPGRARRIVQDGDVIWSTVRPNRRSHALLIDIEPNTIASTGFAVLRARSGDWAWTYETSKTEMFVGFLVGRARGAAYPAVVGSDFEEVPVLVPPPEVRNAFQEIAGPLYVMSSKLNAQNNRLRAARDLLLPKLISGEIGVGRANDVFAEAAE